MLICLLSVQVNALNYSDEFGGSSLDLERWSITEGSAVTINNGNLRLGSTSEGTTSLEHFAEIPTDTPFELKTRYDFVERDSEGSFELLLWRDMPTQVHTGIYVYSHWSGTNYEVRYYDGASFYPSGYSGKTDGDIKITRDNSNKIRVYFDGNLINTDSDSSYLHMTFKTGNNNVWNVPYFNLTVDGNPAPVLPIADSFVSHPRTTDFSNQENLSSVENLTLATNHGVISFGNKSVNAKGQDFDSNIIFGDCYVAVNATNLDYSFNATAYLLMNNSDGHCGDNTIFTTNDVVADVGGIKSSANICKDCELISDTDDSAVKYRVPHFSSYAIGSNSNMTIDANDPRQVNQTVTFTAVYRNSSSGDFISGANCEIDLPNGTVTGMSEGTEEYTYQTSFDTVGNYTYNVTCSANGYQTLKTDDSFEIAEAVEQIPEFNGVVILVLLAGLMLAIFYRKNLHNNGDRK